MAVQGTAVDLGGWGCSGVWVIRNDLAPRTNKNVLVLIFVQMLSNFCPIEVEKRHTFNQQGLDSINLLKREQFAKSLY